MRQIAPNSERSGGCTHSNSTDQMITATSAPSVGLYNPATFTMFPTHHSHACLQEGPSQLCTRMEAHRSQIRCSTSMLLDQSCKVHVACNTP